MNPRLLPSARVARSALEAESDDRLTDLARVGCEPAFEAIVARYRRPLVRYCARLVGEGDAEEVVQDALLKAHAALSGGDPVRCLGAWLRALAHNTAMSHLRARAVRPSLLGSGARGAAPIDRSAEHRQELHAVIDAVRSLPDRQREAIVMREFEGRSYEEIAAQLGSSSGAVRQLLHRARTSMRARLTGLLPLGPLLRLIATGAGGAEVAGGASATGACATGAKACAALLLPAAAALLAAAPTLPAPSAHRRHARTAVVAAARSGTPPRATRRLSGGTGVTSARVVSVARSGAGAARAVRLRPAVRRGRTAGGWGGSGTTNRAGRAASAAPGRGARWAGSPVQPARAESEPPAAGGMAATGGTVGPSGTSGGAGAAATMPGAAGAGASGTLGASGADGTGMAGAAGAATPSYGASAAPTDAPGGLGATAADAASAPLSGRPSRP